MATLTLQPDATEGKDTWITQRSGRQTWNYGVNVLLDVFQRLTATENERGLIEFDLSSIPADATITSAILTLVISSVFGNDITVNVYRIIRAWAEGTGNGSATADGATWLTYDGVNGWGTAGCNNTTTDRAGTTSASYIETGIAEDARNIDLTALVQSWVDGTFLNRGIIFVAGAENTDPQSGVGYKSSDHATAADRPKLVVEYTAAGLAVPVMLASDQFAGGISL